MSHGEDVRRAVVEIAAKTSEAWEKRLGVVLTELLGLSRVLGETDSKLVDFANAVRDTVEKGYGQNVANRIDKGSEAIQTGHGQLSSALEGTTNLTVLTALQRIGVAHEVSTDMAGDVRSTSEAITADLAAKVAAVRTVIGNAMAQIYEPFLDPTEVAQALEAPVDPTQELSVAPDIRNHIRSGSEELQRFADEI